MVESLLSLITSAIVCVASSVPGFSMRFEAERFSPEIAAQVLIASDEVCIDTFGTDTNAKRSMMMDVQAYIDAVSVTSATPTVKAVVFDGDTENEQMRLSIVYPDDGFNEDELEALSDQAGFTASSINDFLCKSLSYYEGDFQHLSLDSPQATAKGSVKNGEAVCMGYANAFTVLAERAGIKSVKVRGYVNGTLHIVNVVSGDLVVDVTWNDKTDNRFLMMPISEYREITGFTPEINYDTAFRLKYGVAQ